MTTVAFLDHLWRVTHTGSFAIVVFCATAFINAFFLWRER